MSSSDSSLEDEKPEQNKFAKLELSLNELQNKIQKIEDFLKKIDINLCYSCFDKKEVKCLECNIKICTVCDFYKKVDQHKIYCEECYDKPNY
ncbi:hypothetical protein BMW23_0155 [Bodo saltans virus]|uniref:Uncharacterized protein n=1 Tax=Bodo saltans virus TaxID=2024608 RepID=A0A2H4UTL7_9VIRU|nr:hypothetical protein QJ851_gp0151 [Bodo saltans virus]ATZ80214.1 hypothetical protein BMW23_0155 [Bodo saltans virus]